MPAPDSHSEFCLDKPATIINICVLNTAKSLATSGDPLNKQSSFSSVHCYFIKLMQANTHFISHLPNRDNNDDNNNNNNNNNNNTIFIQVTRFSLKSCYHSGTC